MAPRGLRFKVTCVFRRVFEPERQFEEALRPRGRFSASPLPSSSGEGRHLLGLREAVAPPEAAVIDGLGLLPAGQWMRYDPLWGLAMHGTFARDKKNRGYPFFA
mmetsp:Transcript_54594/g.152333  ORF Transcript_54594/g.152333 Transcript_54594/m.152333 type:complete len:104 (-) Transcript_54594:2-313(-)